MCHTRGANDGISESKRSQTGLIGFGQPAARAYIIGRLERERPDEAFTVI